MVIPGGVRDRRKKKRKTKRKNRSGRIRNISIPSREKIKSRPELVGPIGIFLAVFSIYMADQLSARGIGNIMMFPFLGLLYLTLGLSLGFSSFKMLFHSKHFDAISWTSYWFRFFVLIALGLFFCALIA
jgi:hypothetical protein